MTKKSLNILLIISSIIFLLFWYNIKKKEEREQDEFFNKLQTQKKTFTNSNGQTSTIEVPAPVNTNVNTFPDASLIYSAEDGVIAYKTPSIGLGETIVFKKNQRIGYYLSSTSSKTGTIAVVYDLLSYNIMYPIGPMFIKTGTENLYLLRTAKVYVK